MAKKTRLDDNADLYQPRDERTEKEKFKSMSHKERWEHFKQYYFKTSLFGLFLVIFIGYFIYSVVSPKSETVLDIAVIDGVIDSDTCSTIQSEMANVLSIDPDTQDIIVDDSYYITSSDYAATAVQKLTTYIMAKEIDVIIAPESVFENYCQSGYFAELSDQLPTQLFSSLTDSFYYGTIIETDEDEDEDEEGDEDTQETTTAESAAYGIRLEGITITDDSGNVIVDPVVGIIVNSEYPDNAASFIQYLCDEGYVFQE